MEIIDKIDRVLNRLDTETKPTQDDVFKIIDLLEKESPEDKIMFLQTRYIVENYWLLDKRRVKENLYFMLNYFNILKSAGFGIEFRKTKPKKVHGAIAKEVFRPKSKDTILELLGEQ